MFSPQYIHDRTLMIDGMTHEYDNVDADELSVGKSWIFPAGEFGIQFNQGTALPEELRDLVAPLWLRITNGDARTIMELLMTHDALRRMGYRDIRLFMPYVPYGRQDRATSPGTAFSLEVFARLINEAAFNQVIAVDPHSQVTEKLFKNLRVIRAADVMAHFPLDQLPCDPKKLLLVAPDKGAVTRVDECAKALGISSDRIMYAHKERDPVTGYLKITGIYKPFEGGEDCELLVIDDICDGGATFIELAKYLKSCDFTQKPTLYVTHGIFSKGFVELDEYYRAIVSTDSFYNQEVIHKVVRQLVPNVTDYDYREHHRVDIDRAATVGCINLL